MKPEALPLRVLSLSLSMDLLAQLESLGQCMDQLGQEATRLPMPQQGLSLAAPAFERSMLDLQAACSRTLERIAALQAALTSEKASLRAQLLTLSLRPPVQAEPAALASLEPHPAATPDATPAATPVATPAAASAPPPPDAGPQVRRKATRALRLQPASPRKRAS